MPIKAWNPRCRPSLSLPTNPSPKPLWHSQCIQIGKVVIQGILYTQSICPKLNPFAITHLNGGSIKEMISTLPNSFPNTNPITTSNFTRVPTHTFLPILPLHNLLLKNFPIEKHISWPPTFVTVISLYVFLYKLDHLMENMIKQFVWQHFCELLIVNCQCIACRKAQGDSWGVGTN